ncbi:WW domain-binding protein 1 [Protopterus annectens]|uniref:WW domain-binding protein 1 n=1 Tax=Protopterus annectens TaxID=7888 RepID=UPI001CFAABC6|nr:WW domain-binding protein 1 [Protopterus annectens]
MGVELVSTVAAVQKKDNTSAEGMRCQQSNPTEDGEGAWGTLHPLLQTGERCTGVNNQPYVCETGHCCGETGCCTYYYELWWFWLLWTLLILFSCCCAYRHRRTKLRIQQQQRQREINLIAYHGACNYPASMLDLRLLASLKLPAYEEVADHPSTPPPPYSAVLAQVSGHYAHPGPSVLTPSQSSDNYTSCSCESSSVTSPSSTSFSVQVTDETETSNETTPTDVETRPDSGDMVSTTHEEAPAEAATADPSQKEPGLSKHALFSSNIDFFEADCHRCSDVEEEGEDEDEGHFRHRRLTGDSGIEVCHCKVDVDDSDEDCAREDTQFLHDSPGCSSNLKSESQQPSSPRPSRPDSLNGLNSSSVSSAAAVQPV